MTQATEPDPSTKTRALPAAVARRGITEYQWNTLRRSTYPGANPESILMVLDYCKARRLDPLKHACHIVPMKVRNALTGADEWRDVILSGIAEYRTTAQRTGLYLGHSAPEYGPVVEYAGVSAPEWCAMTFQRWVPQVGRETSFPVRVFFREVVAMKNGRANARWTQAPVQMLTKCTEAAGLRETFPEEVGGDPTSEEMDGQSRASDFNADATLGDAAVVRALPPAPERYDDWLHDLRAVADEGAERLAVAWTSAPAPLREYLVATDRPAWEALKHHAEAVTRGDAAEPDPEPDDEPDGEGAPA